MPEMQAAASRKRSCEHEQRARSPPRVPLFVQGRIAFAVVGLVAGKALAILAPLQLLDSTCG